MTDLTDFGRLVPRDHGLIVVSTLRADGTIQSSVVNAGVLSHPFTGQPAVGFVVRGGTRKLANLRARPWATVVIRAGWEWAAAEGPAEIIGPDDPAPGVDAERLRLLLREIFAAAGGTHDDWDTYDKVMAQERRAAVLLSPDRVYSNARLSPAVAPGCAGAPPSGRGPPQPRGRPLRRDPRRAAGPGRVHQLRAEPGPARPATRGTPGRVIPGRAGRRAPIASVKGHKPAQPFPCQGAHRVNAAASPHSRRTRASGRGRHDGR
jgi:PPOX class probable F420-dependent enzyme